MDNRTLVFLDVFFVLFFWIDCVFLFVSLFVSVCCVSDGFSSEFSPRDDELDDGDTSRTRAFCFIAALFATLFAL